jgi:outer membrane lipoprotein SlyB
MNTTVSTPSPKPRLHPLVAVAAVAVTLLSAVGIAAITGVLPTGKAASGEQVAAAAPVAAVQSRDGVAVAPTSEQKAAAVEPKAVEKSVPKPVAKVAPKPAAKSAPTEIAQAPAAPVAAPPAPPPCTNCGVVDNIRQITQPGEGSGLGAVAGGVVGAILGHQVGGGTGKKIATVAGAAGGAYAGHQIEKSQRKTTHYEVIVRMSDGSSRSVMMDMVPGWQVGERVRIENGTLVRD